MGAIYTDFQKVFDKVHHKPLLSKLRSYGLNGETEDWVKAFLSDRKYKMRMNGVSSAWVHVTSGMPQGTVLGQVLFVLYINDLPNAIINEVYLFADDTKIGNLFFQTIFSYTGLATTNFHLIILSKMPK